MTVNAFVGLHEHYMGNGVQNEWPIPFPFLQSHDVGAALVTPKGEKVALDSSAYVVQNFSERDGGALYYTVPDGYQLTLYLNQAYTQDVDLRNNGILDAEVLENSLDKLTLLCAQNADELKRAIRVDITASITPEELQEAIFSAKDVAVTCHAEIESNTERVRIWAEQSQEAMKKAEGYSDKVEADITNIEDTIEAKGIEELEKIQNLGETLLAKTTEEANRAEQALPVSTPEDADKVLFVNEVGKYELTTINSGVTGEIVAYSGKMGGDGNRHPVDPRSGEVNLWYVLCDGEPYTAPDGVVFDTPNMCDRFIVGASETKEMGDTGGSENHKHALEGSALPTTLTIAQLAAHGHKLISGTTSTNTSNVGAVMNLYFPQKPLQATIANTGSNQAHSHSLEGLFTNEAYFLPPYYTVAYLLKV